MVLVRLDVATAPRLALPRHRALAVLARLSHHHRGDLALRRSRSGPWYCSPYTCRGGRAARVDPSGRSSDSAGRLVPRYVMSRRHSGVFPRRRDVSARACRRTTARRPQRGFAGASSVSGRGVGHTRVGIVPTILRGPVHGVEHRSVLRDGAPSRSGRIKASCGSGQGPAGTVFSTSLPVGVLLRYDPYHSINSSSRCRRSVIRHRVRDSVDVR